MVPDVCQIIKCYLYWPKFLQVICCYCSCVWSAPQIRGVFCLDISFTSLFRSIRSPSCCFWNPFSFYQECWRSRSLWIRSLRSWRSWWSKRQRVRRDQNVQCRDILVGLWRTSTLGIIFLNCQGIGISGVSASRFKELWNYAAGSNDLFHVVILCGWFSFYVMLLKSQKWFAALTVHRKQTYIFYDPVRCKIIWEQECPVHKCKIHCVWYGRG